MDSLILDAVIGLGGIALGALSLQAAKLLKKPAELLAPEAERHEHIDIPLIEIDGEMVPHPTVLAWRALKDKAS